MTRSYIAFTVQKRELTLENPFLYWKGLHAIANLHKCIIQEYQRFLHLVHLTTQHFFFHFWKTDNIRTKDSSKFMPANCIFTFGHIIFSHVLVLQMEITKFETQVCAYHVTTYKLLVNAVGVSVNQRQQSSIQDQAPRL